MVRNFREILERRWNAGKFVCIGLDSSDATRMRAIVDATHDLVVAYKPNTEFYFADGSKGLEDLAGVIDHIYQVAPETPVILDRKAGDIGNTNLGTIKMAFDFLGVDAITVNPYPGKEGLQPFLDNRDKGIFVWVRSSNPGAAEFQDLKIHPPRSGNWTYTEPLYQYIAKKVAEDWNQRGNCGLVVGAPYSEELAKVRQIVGASMPILIPGIGAQGGNLEASVRAAGGNMIINSSRSIIFASSGSDFAEAARAATLKLHQQIQTALAGTS